MSYDQIQNDLFNRVRPPLLSPYFSAVWSYFGGPWRSIAGFSKPWGRDDDGDDYDNIDEDDNKKQNCFASYDCDDNTGDDDDTKKQHCVCVRSGCNPAEGPANGSVPIHIDNQGSHHHHKIIICIVTKNGYHYHVIEFNRSKDLDDTARQEKRRTCV